MAVIARSGSRKSTSPKGRSRMFSRKRDGTGDVYEVVLSTGRTVYTTSLTDKLALEAATQTAREADDLVATLSSAESR